MRRGSSIPPTAPSSAPNNGSSSSSSSSSVGSSSGTHSPLKKTMSHEQIIPENGLASSGSTSNLLSSSTGSTLSLAGSQKAAAKRQTTQHIKTLLESERKEFEALAKEYENLYDPPEALERKLVETQKKIESLEQQLANRAQLYDQRGCSEARQLRYLAQEGTDYKFTEPDSEDNIIFEDEDEETVQAIPTIRAATLTKLVERLTFDEYSDPNFLLQFLLTSKSFCTPDALFSLLIERFSMPIPSSFPEETIEKFKTTILNPIRLRVLNVFKNWLDKHFTDFERRPVLLEALKDFLTNTVSKASGMEKQLEVIQRLIAKKESLEREENKQLYITENPPEPLLPPDGLVYNDILQYDPLEIARQLTLLEYDLYRSISPTDLSQLACGDVMEDSFTALSNRFNEVSNWIVTVIVTTRSPQLRTEIMVKFIQIAVACNKLNNFNAVFEVVSALLSTPVHRLKKTWAAIPDDMRTTFDELAKGVARRDNFKQYRANLLSVNPPCIPYLGVYLTDLTFIRDANPNTYPDTDLINFSKRRRISEVLMSLQQYQQARYQFHPVEEIKNMLINLPSLSVDDAYRESLKIEPRENALKNQDKKIGFIVNYTARLGKAEKLWEKLLPRVEEFFSGRYSVVTTKHPGHGEDLAKELMKSGHSIIVAVGGDGTANEVANGYLKNNGLINEAVVGIIPLGLNDSFAKMIGLPSDPADALRIIHEGYTLQCDAGVAIVTNDMGKPTNSFFLNNATIGLLTELIKLEQKNTKNKTPKDAWKHYLSQSISYTIDHEHWLSTNNMCIMGIGNGRTVGNCMELFPEADTNDGLLDITIVDADEEQDATKILQNLRKGKLLLSDYCRMGHSKDIEVRNVYPGDKISVSVDGEDAGYLPVTVRIVEGGIALIVPSNHGFSKAYSTLKKSDVAAALHSPSARRNSSLPPVPEALTGKKGSGFFFKDFKVSDLNRFTSPPTPTKRSPSASMLDSLFKRSRGKSDASSYSAPPTVDEGSSSNTSLSASSSTSSNASAKEEPASFA